MREILKHMPLSFLLNSDWLDIIYIMPQFSLFIEHPRQILIIECGSRVILVFFGRMCCCLVWLNLVLLIMRESHFGLLGFRVQTQFVDNEKIILWAGLSFMFNVLSFGLLGHHSDILPLLKSSFCLSLCLHPLQTILISLPSSTFNVFLNSRISFGLSAINSVTFRWYSSSVAVVFYK